MIITSLSPSMVNTYRQCPYKFYCQYCLKLPRRSNMPIAFGCAFHAMAEENYYQKVRTQKDLPIDLLTDFFVADLEFRDDVDWKEQEQTLDQTTDDGVKTVRAFQEKVAPGIQPVEVEHLWSMEVGGRDWVITGKTDLLTEQGARDIKTKSQKESKPRDADAFQISTYVMARRAQTGRQDIQGWIDCAVRGKDQTFSHALEFGSDLAQRVVSTFDNVAKCIQREWWPKHSNGNYLCSQKYCDFWEVCGQDGR